MSRTRRRGVIPFAKRFENKLFGLIWIGIPSKGMLLDSKLNRQLANECKNAEQSRPVQEAIVPTAQPTAQPAANPQPNGAPNGSQTTQQAVPGQPAA